MWAMDKLLGIAILPIVSGHRGYKGKYPENTILGFDKCFETGAHHFETDVYLTADDVVVISHDVNTKRTYVHPNGDEADFNIPTSSYETDLKDLVNKHTGDKFLTFRALCEYIQKREDIPHRGVMLDIKTYNKPRILKNLIQELLEVDLDINYWLKVFQFGVWDLDFVKYLNQEDYFQNVASSFTEKFQLYHISTSCDVSNTFINYNHFLEATNKDRFLFKVNGISILYLATWSRTFLEYFLPIVKLNNMDLFTWTINSTYQYDYFANACKFAQINQYGVMSDDPGAMMEHKRKVDGDKALKPALDWQQVLSHKIFRLFILFAPKRAPNFESTVDPNARALTKINPVFRHLFGICQYFGIF